MARRDFQSSLDDALKIFDVTDTLAAPGNPLLRQDFVGNNSSETIDGTNQDDTIDGRGGNDTLNGNGGNDVITGGSGTNTLSGGSGADIFLFQSRGLDFIDTITDFNLSEDRIDLSILNVADFETLFPYLSQDGNDAVLTFGFNNRDEQFILQGIDAGDLNATHFIFNTSTDNLTVTATGNRFNSHVLFGGNGNDTLTGASRDDELNGGAGNDRLEGSFGTNILRGGEGNDVFAMIARGTQNQIIKDFEQGQDRIDVSFLNVANFDDLLLFFSQDSDDSVLTTQFTGQTEQIRIENFDLNDLTADDFIFNTSATGLTVTIGDGSRFQSYTLFGGNGDDSITAGERADTLVGGAGDDVFDGSFGTNTIYMGAGADTLTFSDRGTQTNIIKDFSISDDRIDLREYNIADMATLMPYISQDGSDVVIQTFWNGQDEVFRIENVQLADLTDANFRFNTFAADRDVDIGDGSRFQSYVLFGGNGDDDIVGGERTDELNGGAGNDDLSGGLGNNILRGGAGNDDFNFTVRGTQNTTIEDFVIGEDDLDVRNINVADFQTLSYYLSQDGDDVVLNTIFAGGAEVFRLKNINLADLSADDFLFNTNTADLTVTRDGNSSLQSYWLFGGNGNDEITGAERVDSLNGGAGDDTLNGLGGSDFLRGGDGADTLNGGNGFDLASYAMATSGVTINLQTGVISGDQADGDTYDSIEGVEGTEFADTLTGLDDVAGRFDGRGGDDVITTGGAADRTLNIVNGGDGNDTITGGDGVDEINGDAGNDMIMSGAGNDRINGGDGDDIIDGGAGSDTIVSGDGNDNVTDESGQANIILGAGDDFANLVGNFNGSHEVVGGDGQDTLALDAFFNISLNPFTGAVVTTHEALNESPIDDYLIGNTGIEFFQIEGIDFSLADTNFITENTTQLFLGEDSTIKLLRPNVDQAFGFGGNDYLVSTNGAQQLFGGSGSDYLMGNGGDDILSGDTSVALSGIEGQVFRAYQSVFDRAPDVGGFNAFVTEIRLGNLTQADVITEFVGSTEFQDTFGNLTPREFVQQLYRNLFNREGDEGGVNAFTAAIEGGRTRASVVIELSNSAEFLQVTTITSAAFATNVVFDPTEGDVFRVYQAMLDRAPDAVGFNNFVNSIQGGTLQLLDVINEFIESPEFSSIYGTLSNAEFVETLYQNVLPGNTDQAGRAAFTNALQNSELTRAEVVADFVNSFEFRQATNQATLDYTRIADPGATKDVLFGGTGDDFMVGGRGGDLFIYVVENGGNDVIGDFVNNTSINDTIRIIGTEDFDTFAEIIAAASQEGNDVAFNFGNGNGLRLQNVTLANLSESDFEIIAADGSVAAEDVDVGILAQTSTMTPEQLTHEAIMQLNYNEDGSLVLDDGYWANFAIA